MKRHYIIRLITIAALTCLTSIAYAQPTAPSFTPAQQAEIQNIVHDYLVKNPSVLVEAARALQHTQQGAVQEKTQQAITRYSVRLFESPQTPTAGNPRGDVNVVEFFDYQCSHCKHSAPVLLDLMKKDPNVRVIYKELPIFGGDSEFASQAALAARKQGKYLQLHEALMLSKDKLTPDVVLNIARQVGLDIPKLQSDMQDKAILSQIQENTMIAEALGVAGTPSFIIATNPVINPHEKVKSYFISGAANEDTLRNFIAEARKK